MKDLLIQYSNQNDISISNNFCNNWYSMVISMKWFYFQVYSILFWDQRGNWEWTSLSEYPPMCSIYHMISHENAGKVHLTKPICAMNEDWHGLVRYLVRGLTRTVFYRGSRVDGYPTWQWRRSTDSLDHAHCRHNIYVALSEWVSLLRLVYDKNNDDDLIIIKSNSCWRIANMARAETPTWQGAKKARRKRVSRVGVTRLLWKFIKVFSFQCN